MTFFIIPAILLFACLLIERFRLDRFRRGVSLCICVTGTRGKTSVTRMIASVLRESGAAVLAKTTGTEPVYILPDGSEEPVKRRGIVSIIEQKKLLSKAYKLGADTIVSEVMSIHPENHAVESCNMLRPDIVVITNFRPDHIDAQGKTPSSVARVLSLAVPDGTALYLPEKERAFLPDFITKNSTVRVHTVPEEQGLREVGKRPAFAQSNRDLAYAVCRRLEIPEETITRGIESAQFDAGECRIRKLPGGAGGSALYAVNAFAANDPESTIELLDTVKDMLPGDLPVFGLFASRGDRGSRTAQWIDALNNGCGGRFRRLYACGPHARIAARRIPGAERLTDSPPEIMQRIRGSSPRDCIIFGFGNIGGVGMDIVRYWETAGEPYGV